MRNTIVTAVLFLTLPVASSAFLFTACSAASPCLEIIGDNASADQLAECIESAERGDPESQDLLGMAYQRGRVFPRNNRMAVYWYEKSAEQSHPPGMLSLGVMYRAGLGVPQDRVVASMWFRLAIHRGRGRTFHLARGEMKRMRSAMTQAELAEGKRLAQIKMIEMWPDTKVPEGEIDPSKQLHEEITIERD
jgi:TPR repeat protein